MIDSFGRDVGTIDNNIIVVGACSKNSLLKGSTTYKGYKDHFRLRGFPTVSVLNPFRPTREQARILTNPVIMPITLEVVIGSSVPYAFQALCDGSNLGTMTLTELISDGNNLQPLRTLKLENTYVTFWKLLGGRDGGICQFTVTFDVMTQTRASVSQTQKKQGKTAATTNQSTGQPKS